MFFSTPLIGAAALLSGFTAALPRPDSAIGDEVAVSAPNGTPISALATQSGISQTTSAASAAVTSVDSYSDSGYIAQAGSGWSSQAWTTATALASSYSAPSYDSGSSWYSAPSSGSGSSWYSAPSSGSGSSSYSAPQIYSSASSWYSASSYDSASSSYVAPPAYTSASSSYSPPSYGSGSSSWGSENYNSCVQQCAASYGGPSAATYTPPTATSASGYGSSGLGATHTVIVAPTQGVLRFVPFALNASVGDTLQFVWGANNHTVTKSSSLTPCNKTLDNPFSSGEQNKGFVFTQVVNDTNPLFFYCGTPTHCEKGMFGIINPPNALGSPTSATNMIEPLAANDSTIAAYADYTNSMTASNAAAAGWGGSIDMASLPTWSHSYVAENIMYTRNFLAANSEVLGPDGSVNLGSAGSTPLMYPQDLGAAVNSTGATTTSSPVASASSSGSYTNKTSAAISTSSSKVLPGLLVGFVTLMMF